MSSSFSGNRLIWMLAALLGAMTLSITVSVGPAVESLPGNVEFSGSNVIQTETPASAIRNDTTPHAHVTAAQSIGKFTGDPAVPHGDELIVTPVPRSKPRRGRHSTRERPNNYSNFIWSVRDGCLARRNPKERQRLRVLCLGDSITYGNGSHTRLARREPGGNYPLMLRVDEGLKSVLCPDTRIEVVNLGWNGCSVQEGKRCYRNTLAYRSALRRMRTADVVVFILGTNDSKDYNWQGSDAFEEALFQYMEEIMDAGHSKLEVIVAAPPPVYPNPLHFSVATSHIPQTSTAFRIRMDRVRNEIRDSVTAVAEDLGITFLDLYSSVLSSIPELDNAGMRMERGQASADDAALVKKYYHDGVHPYSPTHEIITAAVRDAIVWALNQTNITRVSTNDELWWREQLPTKSTSDMTDDSGNVSLMTDIPHTHIAASSHDTNFFEFDNLSNS
jgi:lysophospholipase L1-like esterase